MSASIDIDELKRLIEEYLQTRSDEEYSKDERFLTPRGFAEDEMNDFLWWLENRGK